MAISDNVQTLLAAFVFGILLQAASGVFLIYFNGHGGTIFQDGRRLVLLLFLFFAAFWALIDFLNLLISTKSSTTCQATLVFSTISDQLARVGIEQFLLWSVGNGTKVTTERLILQAILGVRIIAGGLLVGFTRPEFGPACVARTSLLPISIIVIALDFIIIGVLIIRALSCGMFRDLRAARSSTHREQSRALILIVVGLLVWTGTSVVMLLGIPTTLLILRTLLPSIGLFSLIGIIASSSGSLLLPNVEQLTTPEATSPFVTPSPPTREIFRGNVGNGSPIAGHNYTKSGSLFVVNPSVTPRDSPTVFQGSQVDTKGFTKLGGDVTIRAMGTNDPDQSEIKKGPGYRGSSGVFPTILTASSMSANNGAVAPLIRPAGDECAKNLPAFPPPAPQAQQKRSLFSWSKQVQQPTVRSLGISKPVMNPNQDLQPFARMETIDLATAATNERERREAAARRSRLVANRPAPYPPGLAPQEALRQSISLKRKEMPNQPQGPMPTIQSSGASGHSLDVVNGSTTSASLSPGREEVRRRSPRNANGFDKLSSEPELLKPSLERKQTLGLPSNPRSQRITMAQEAGRAKEQTVMFINDIVYDDPGMVKTIISGAPGIYAFSRRPKTSGKSPTLPYSAALKTSGSIIHRPRPIRRDTEKDRVLFPSEPSPGHKRSKSGSSITTRKSILMSHPGSPTQLPPLPAPPTSAAKLMRLLPNDTKSMTFDEKIELLFPAPPGSALMRHRRSSVPSLPRVPSIFMSDTPAAQSPTEDERGRRASKRTTIASFGLLDFQAAGIAPKVDASLDTEHQTYRFSANTYRTLADEVGQTLIPGIPRAEVGIPHSVQTLPIPETQAYDMRKSAFTDTTFTDESSQDDSTTYWGSIHSEVPAVDFSTARRNAKATVIQHGGPPVQGPDSGTLPPSHGMDYNDGDDIMTVMLHPDEHENLLSGANRQSFFLDADQSLPGDATPTPRSEAAWHRRIGDELPTFSERRKNSRARKMLPPTPLLLNSKGRNATVIVRMPEPSPVDSPERAIKEIQAQLKRFEEPSRGSVGSILRHMPDGTTEKDEDYDSHEDRFKLLENLEKEMGQQENQWQQMQTNLDRDSVSVVMTPQPPQEQALSPRSSQRSSRTPPQIVSRRARVRSSLSLRSKSQDSTSTTSTQSSDNSRASVWQKRLAEAQMEYLENAPVLLRKRSLNFLSVSKVQLGSPTPPDSVDSGTDSEIESDFEYESHSEQQLETEPVEYASLWQPPMTSPKAAVGRMWNPPYDVATQTAPSEPPAKNVRPRQRIAQDALPISSRELWSKPHSSANSRPVIGLWGSKLVRPRSIVTRRVTQRPQRKSKRVTFLPDIVESPQPLPDKRDTLGIFQFPWGETSDSAVYQPAFNPMVLAGPINAKLEARSRELEPETTEYSSSFFDDYDEPDEDDLDSDDDFDETTLWEIASLLKSEDVPSKNSLLPPPREVIEDYDDETDFESESEDQSPVSKVRPVQLPIQPLATVPKIESQLRASPESMSPIEEVASLRRNVQAMNKTSASTFTVVAGKPSSLWTLQQPRVEIATIGLFTPDTTRPIIRRTAANPAAYDMVKASRSMMTQSLNVSSQNLWIQNKSSKPIIEWISRSTSSSFAAKLWAPKLAAEPLVFSGLFIKSDLRLDYRTTSASPAAITLIRRPRTIQAPLSRLRSNELWNGRENLPIDHHWISESSTRPESPSVYSETSSGRSSPVSDASSIKSNSTKSSSLWSSIKSAGTPAWWDSKSKKKSAPSSPDKTISFPKLPVRGPPVTALPPVRESRVLASKDLWEASALSIKAPVRKALKSSASDTQLGIAKKPLRHQYRTVTAFRSNWDDALAEAIAAGKPKTTLIRPTATAAEWEAALSNAVSASLSRLQRPKCTPQIWKAALNEALPTMSVSSNIKFESHDASVRHPVFFAKTLASNARDIHPAALGYTEAYDVAVRHPVFFTRSFVSAANDTHPAATGYITRSEVHDVAVRHPVFFTRSFVSTANDTHPAATGYITQPEARIVETVKSGMWTKSKGTKSYAKESSGSMWSKGTVYQRVELSHFIYTPEETMRKAVLRSNDLPILQSKTFWQPSERVSSVHNWLSDTTRSRSQTWAPRKTEISEQAVMWAPARKPASPNLPDLFASIPKGSRIKKSTPCRLAHLPRLESSELFTSTTSTEEAMHWLAATSIRELKPVKRSRTWTAPSSVLSASSLSSQESTKLWEARPAPAVHSPGIFSNPHSEPWSRKKRDEMAVEEMESQEMWKRDTAMPQSPNDWLIKKRSSRVEFRY